MIFHGKKQVTKHDNDHDKNERVVHENIISFNFQNTKAMSKTFSNLLKNSQSIQNMQFTKHKNREKVKKSRSKFIETKSFINQKNVSDFAFFKSFSSGLDTIKKKPKRFKKLTFKNFTIKDKKNPKKFIKTELKKEVRMKIASSKHEEFIIIKIEDEEFKTEYTIRYLHFYSRFIVEGNTEKMKLMSISNKFIKSKTDANIVKI